MKKYTQRELHNEAFRDMLRGIGKVVGKGAIGAAKKVAKYISPEIYGLAKGAKGIYDKEQSKKAIISHISSGRPVDVYNRTVPRNSIVTGNVKREAKGGNVTQLRLYDPVDIKLVDRSGGITISSFKAINYSTEEEEPFLAYIFRDEVAEGSYKVFALQSTADPTTASDSSGTGSSSAGTPEILGNDTNTGSSSAGTP